jgi:hypothetical protein
LFILPMNNLSIVVTTYFSKKLAFFCLKITCAGLYCSSFPFETRSFPQAISDPGDYLNACWLYLSLCFIVLVGNRRLRSAT